MSSRTVIVGELHRPLRRITRRGDGKVVGVAILRDRCRGLKRFWTVYVEDLEAIEKLERMRVGESFAAAGPFSIGSFRGEEELRLTAYAVINGSEPRKRKSMAQIRREEAITSDEADDAPGELTDSIPF